MIPRSVQQAATGSQWLISRIPEDIDLDLSKITQEERRFHVCMFLSRRISSYGVLKKGALAETAEAFQIKYGGVRGIWNRYKKAIIEPEKYESDVPHCNGTPATKPQHKGVAGRKDWDMVLCTERRSPTPLQKSSCGHT